MLCGRGWQRRASSASGSGGGGVRAGGLSAARLGALTRGAALLTIGALADSDRVWPLDGVARDATGLGQWSDFLNESKEMATPAFV